MKIQFYIFFIFKYLYPNLKSKTNFLFNFNYLETNLFGLSFCESLGIIKFFYIPSHFTAEISPLPFPICAFSKTDILYLTHTKIPDPQGTPPFPQGKSRGCGLAQHCHNYSGNTRVF